MRHWRALVVVGLAAAGLVGFVPPVGAAPLLAGITRVGPADLPEADVADLSSDGRWALAALAAGGVQRIDRQNNTASAPLALDSATVALTDDGAVVQADVASDGEITIVSTNPANLSTQLLSVGSLGAGTWSRVGRPDASASGRFVAFAVADAGTGRQVVVLADTASPAGFVVADADLPPVADRRSAEPVVSADGRFVAFTSSSATPGCTDGPGCGDVWVYDGTTGDLDLASPKAGGGASSGVAERPGLSASGRFAVFTSDATDLVAGVPDRQDRIYVRDLLAGTTTLVPGEPSDGPLPPRAAAVSADGRIVAFTGLGTADVGGSIVDVDTVLVADLFDGSVQQVPRATAGGPPDGAATSAFLRADGSEVVFASSATNLLASPPLVPWGLYATRIGGPESAGTPPPQARAKFVAVEPFRVLDTRIGIGAAAVKPAPGATVAVTVAGVGAVPADATAVALNVTATEATGPGYVTVFPGATALPLASSLNLTHAGQTVPNFVVVTVGSNDQVNLYTDSGTHLLADVLGYFVRAQTSTDGRYVALQPARVLDTRIGIGAPAGWRSAGSTTAVDLRGAGGVPPAGASAVVLNVTATAAGGWGYVSVYPGGPGAAPPNASNLNLVRPDQTVPNLVVVPLGSDGTVHLFTSVATHLLADVAGYLTDASAPSASSGLYVALGPLRIQDTRTPFPRALGEAGNATVRANLPPLPASGVAAAVLNVTATQAAAPGYLTVYPSHTPLPNASNLNVEYAGQTVPNAVIATLAAGTFDVFTRSGTHLIVDVFGYFRS